MSKNILIAIVFSVALYTVPQYTQAAGVTDLGFVYDTELRFESLIKDPSVSRDGAVLGVSTDDKKKKVTTKLEKKRSSYFRDLSVSTPKGWYLTEEVIDWYITDKSDEEVSGLTTQINNEEMTAAITITRVDSNGGTLDDFAAELEEVCVQCGFKILDKGNAKMAGQKGRFIVYFVQLTAKLDEWKRYEKILEKSASTLKLKK